MRRDIAICLGLFLGTLLLYFPTVGHDFVSYDDGLYVTENLMVQRGLNLEGVKWAFTTYQAGNWHPLTMMSHMLDVSLFGLNAGGHHATSLLFHCMNAVLVFLVFRRYTGALWASAFIAAFFAWHPLRVESVAWVSERKDVLSTFFGMLALYVYHSYANDGGRKRYLLTLGWFILSLLCKPMLVTLPCLLLLLDVWPLGRWTLPATGKPAPPTAWLPPDWKQLIIEKLPFFALSAAMCVVTVFSQDEGGAVAELKQITLLSRIGNAGAGYLGYLGKTAWPVDLAVLYPLTQQVPWGRAIAGWLAVAGGSVLALKWLRTKPWFAVGWFWFVGTLVPVIGLVQVGSQAMADRYTYVPGLGLGLILASPIQHWARDESRRKLASLGSGLVLVVCALFTTVQLRTWENTITLFRNATEVTRDNEIAHNNLGSALIKVGELEEALHHLQEAVRIQPGYAGAHANLGLALTELKRHEEARNEFAISLKLRPDLPPTHYFLGINLAGENDVDGARKHLLKGVELAPHDVPMRIGASDVLLRLGLLTEAADMAAETVRLAPDNAAAWYVEGMVKLHQNKPAETMDAWRKSAKLNPDSPDAWRSLARLLATHPKLADTHAQEALKLAGKAMEVSKEQNAGLLETLAAAQANSGQFQSAIRTVDEAVGMVATDPASKLAADLRKQRALYQSGKPLRETGVDRK